LSSLIPFHPANIQVHFKTIRKTSPEVGELRVRHSLLIHFPPLFGWSRFCPTSLLDVTTLLCARYTKYYPLKILEITAEPELVSNINQRKSVGTIATHLTQKLASSFFSSFLCILLNKYNAHALIIGERVKRARHYQVLRMEIGDIYISIYIYIFVWYVPAHFSSPGVKITLDGQSLVPAIV